MELTLRAMKREDWSEVSDLIYLSTNYWYETHGRSPIFTGDPSCTELFCEVYEALDPGCCFVAEHSRTGRLAGSCFYHPRETHVSLGIMNVHPNYFGKGIARQLLTAICDIADSQKKPVRLVSSGMNLDSFSLYTRAGFVPRMLYQDMFLKVPAEGMRCPLPEYARIRPGQLSDLPAIVALEMEIQYISREKDYRFFLENEMGIWHVSVLEKESGGLDGFLCSIAHPASNMFGPGVCRTQKGMAALIYAEWNEHKGRQPVFVIPAECSDLVAEMYGAGAKNCQFHFSQIRGAWQTPAGVVMPTFMPETS